MKKLGAIVITVLAISLLTGVLGSNCLAEFYYLPLISKVPPPPPPPPPATIDQFVGSWTVSDATGATAGYLYIRSDNTFSWLDHPNDPSPHFSGTGSVTNGTFTGPFTNGTVGDGELVCTIAANGSMNIDFIEFWHSPPKHVPYTATKF
jgi:hypothetical protein